LIRSRVEQGINVKQLLSEVEISRSTLERLFRQHMGCTPYEYVTRCRIDRVKSLLLHTDYPLSRVARMSGFRREGHMGAMFRSRTGVTPTSFRESRGYAVPKG
jgi:transcriptional regulator GlxA family with amidase domain